ncbi:MAG: hypothetical protein NT155_03600 [Candidatus Staskawiczbacteria bacterium]|nr:hypothetical protein [Candidatus Staskawiczbacteria bacterium]
MKGPMLPKWMWVKGKSKNFYPRLKQEGIAFGVNPWLGQMIDSPMSQLIRKLKKELKK